jgi:hypothetical protein
MSGTREFDGADKLLTAGVFFPAQDVEQIGGGKGCNASSKSLVRLEILVRPLL